MNDSVPQTSPRPGVLIGAAAALLGELCALVYMMYAYRNLWGDETIGVFVFSVGTLIPTLLVLDRLKSGGTSVDAVLPRRLLFFGFIAGALGVGLIPSVGVHGAAVFLLWLLAPQAVLHTMAFRRLRKVED